MARVYLISPPDKNVYKKINSEDFGVQQPPLGLAYIASFLKSRGHSVKLFDSSFSKKVFKDIKAHLHEFNPDFIGITATTPQITDAFIIAEYIKSINLSIKVILGGPHASALPEEVIRNQYVDMVICGEGEITISEIVEGKDLEEIKGICFLQDGRVNINPSRPLIENLDTLPFPLWEQLPMKEYYFFPERTIGIISGRGCPYKCSFCASGIIHKRRYRMRSPSNFVDELNWLYKKFGIKHFFFVDETFTINHNRVEEICSLILEKSLPIKWTCQTRVGHLTKELLKRMKAAGCDILRIGIESGDEKVLKATDKGITLEQAENAVSWANKLGIKCIGYFMLGLPYETPASLKKILKFSKKLRLFLVHFVILVPLPGTPIWNMIKEGKILRCTARNWSEYARLNKAIVESDAISASQLSKYHRRMLRSYFFDPNFILRKIRDIKSFKDASICLKGGMTMLKMIISKS